MSPYEQAQEHSHSKFALNWSLPAKVIKIKDKQVELKTSSSDERQVLLSQVYKLKGSVNPLLTEINYKQFREVFPKNKFASEKTAPSENWNEVLNTLEEEDKFKNNKDKKKRRRAEKNE